MSRLFHNTRTLGILLLVCAGSSLLISDYDVLAQDTSCGGLPCEETTICASSSVISCSDWNDRSADDWAVSPYGGGTIKAGVGRGGTAAWEAVITQGQHGSIYFSRPLAGAGFGPLYARFYVKFSPGYIFIPTCGLQKMFYLESNAAAFWRVMLGIAPANWMGGSFASLPQTVGIFGFDYIGHIVRLPDGAGDSPVLIYPNQWYSVEMMAHWTSRTQNVVKVWVNGQLQMTRQNFDDGQWTTSSVFTDATDSSHYGGNDPACLPVQTQYVYKDNHVISKSYIGPIGGDTTPPAPPTGLVIR